MVMCSATLHRAVPHCATQCRHACRSPVLVNRQQPPSTSNRNSTSTSISTTTTTSTSNRTCGSSTRSAVVAGAAQREGPPIRIKLQKPDGSVTEETLCSQHDLYSVLADAGCKGGFLQDVSGNVRVRSYAGVVNGATYKAMLAQKPCPDTVFVLVPDDGGDLKMPMKLTQRAMDAVVDSHGACGFLHPDTGSLLTDAEELQSGSTYRLMMPRIPTLGQQVSNLQAAKDNEVAACEDEVASFLKAKVEEDFPGKHVIELPREAFKGPSKEDVVQIDAAFVVQVTDKEKLLVFAEHKTTLDLNNLGAASDKLDKIKSVLVAPATCPDLSTHLHGVKNAKVYLAGAGVSRRTSMATLAKMAGLASVGVILPSGKALGLVVDAGEVQVVP